MRKIVVFLLSSFCAIVVQAQPSVPMSYSLDELDVVDWFKNDTDSLLFRLEGSNMSNILKDKSRGMYFDVHFIKYNNEVFCHILLYKLPPIPIGSYFGCYQKNGYVYILYGDNVDLIASVIKGQKKMLHTKSYKPNEIPVVYDPPGEILKIDLDDKRLLLATEEEIDKVLKHEYESWSKKT